MKSGPVSPILIIVIREGSTTVNRIPDMSGESVSSGLILGAKSRVLGPLSNTLDSQSAPISREITAGF